MENQDPKHWMILIYQDSGYVSKVLEYQNEAKAFKEAFTSYLKEKYHDCTISRVYSNPIYSDHIITIDFSKVTAVVIHPYAVLEVSKNQPEVPKEFPEV